MASLLSSSSCTFSPLLLISTTCFFIASASNFYQDFEITWGDGRAKILNNGDLFTLNLDQASGSGFRSKNSWATRGGLVKTNWSNASFTALYRIFNAENACVVSSGANSCASNSNVNSWLSQELDLTIQERLQWVQKNYMIYNYCTNLKRFPRGLPVECKTS